MAKSKKGDSGEVQPIIVIKKIKKVAGGHHGGAWKVAYADFVTAMMAFFLLLWLLNVTTSEQRDAIANFFDPTHPTINDSKSGAGGVMGGTTISTEGSMSSTMQEIRLPNNSGAARKGAAVSAEGSKSTAKQLEEKLREREEKRFEQAKKEIEKSLKENPDLAELQKHLMVDITPEGLRIQIIDQEDQPMFQSGSAQVLEKARKLIVLAAGVIKTMPNSVSIRGHTDAYKYKSGATYTNWELSADRANSTRRVLLESSIDEKRLSNVMGKADREHMFPDKPLDARNRRISIILENEDLESLVEREGKAAANEIGASDEAVDEVKEMLRKAAENQDGVDFRRTPGDVYFP